MNLLAIETSTEWCSAALCVGARVFVRDEPAGQRHSELLLPMVDALLRDGGVAYRDLHGVAFGAGPGSFTGLRIACGVTQGLAFALDLPVAPVSTLEALAQATGAQRVIACLDARMGEIYHAVYQRAGERWHAVHPPGLMRPEQAPPVDGGGWVGSGSGFAQHAEALRARYRGQLEQVREELFPHAREVAQLGTLVLQRGEGLSPDQAVPMYVRDKIALSVSERAARAAGAPAAGR